MCEGYLLFFLRFFVKGTIHLHIFVSLFGAYCHICREEGGHALPRDFGDKVASSAPREEAGRAFDQKVAADLFGQFPH